MTKPLINVKNFIHMIALCLNLIMQTLTVLVMIFHVYALVGMTFFNIEMEIHYPTEQYSFCRQL